MVQEILFKIFLIRSSGGPPVRCNGTISAILKEGIMGNIHVKLYEIWTSGSRRSCPLKNKFMDGRTMDGWTKAHHNSSAKINKSKHFSVINLPQIFKGASSSSKIG